MPSPPAELPRLPESWLGRYERLAAEHELGTQVFPTAVDPLRRLWVEMFPTSTT